MSVEEALLTGESVAVNKNTDVLKGGEALAIGDRLNMAFAATTVQKGRGTGVVTATAALTEIGQIADSLRTTESEKPPLIRRMESFSKMISIVLLVVCIILGFVGYAEGMPAAKNFLFNGGGGCFCHSGRSACCLNSCLIYRHKADGQKKCYRT